MALPSRLGAFTVVAALGAAQCFYGLHDDVNQLHSAMKAKIDDIKSQVSSTPHFTSVSILSRLTIVLVACSKMEETNRIARLELAALDAAVARDSTAEAIRQSV